jgi:hypothetical protein
MLVRMPKELHADLVAAAADRDVSANWLACRLLRRGLDGLPTAADAARTLRPSTSEKP